tara:strand:- start:365 stop:3313 length:2949 start_codon:yes stop_codon:yes gene_type:complete
MPEASRPLSYIDWIQTVDLAVTSESDLFGKYQDYVSNFYTSRDAGRTSQAEAVRNMYRDLLKEITLNFSTVEERRFLSNIDYTNPKELDVIIPYFVRKLKDITQYIVRKRQEVKFSKIQTALKGSEGGVKRIIKNTIIRLLNNPDFTDKYPDSYIPNITLVANSISVDIESLYDEYQNYFDSDSSVDKDVYADQSDKSLYNFYSSNVESRDSDLWLDLIKAVEDLFEEIPIVLQTGSTDLETSTNLGLNINFTRSEVADLPYRYFVSTSKTTENLAIQYKKALLQKYAGTRMLYLSTNSTANVAVTGVLYEPSSKSANILNRYYSSHATSPSINNLQSLRSKGGFFLPHKEGLLNYAGFNSYTVLDEDKLKPNTLYTFPDPLIYGTGRGNTKTDQDAVYDTIDDISAIKGSRSDTQKYGDIVNDKGLQKFYPYQSREESLGLHTTGLSRSTDNVDFWTGDLQNIWANSDVYPIKGLGTPPFNDKLEDLLISSQTVYQWRSDMYGNEYALYKDTIPTRRTSEQISGDLTNTTTRSTDTTQFRSTSGQIFERRDTNYYNYTLSGFGTAFQDTASVLTTAKTITEKRDAAGNFYFRNLYSNVIGPVSSALSGVFVKYKSNADMLDQINNNIINFDIINDTIILETGTFIFIEQYDFNLETGVFRSKLPKKIFLSLSGTSPALEQFGNIWYNEEDKDIFITRTVLHSHLSASNHKIIYPNIYKFDMNTGQLDDLYTFNTIISTGETADVYTKYSMLTAEGFNTGNTNDRVSLLSAQDINITSISKPSISHNSLDNTLSINFVGYDQGTFMYLYNWYFDGTDVTKYRVKQLDMFKPSLNILNFHTDNIYATNTEPALSGNIIGDLQRGSIREQNIVSFDALAPETLYYGVNFSTVRESSISGRMINPSHYIDTITQTVRMGVGVSANDVKVAEDAPREAVAGYSHNSSYLLCNAGLSGVNSDIVVTFDVALYTLTSQNSAYVQVNRT